MKKTELKAIEQALDNEIKSTEQKIVEYSLLCQPIAPENSIGRVSRMDAINNKSIVEAALRKAKEKYSKLKLVLDKVDDSDFGLCIRCGKPIPIGRILLMPQSRYCVSCAQ